MNTIKGKVEAYVRSQILELMELSFGCEVAFEGSVGMPHIWHGATSLGITPAGSVAIFTSFIRYIEPDKLKIIGHPIQLQHWLRVISKSKKDYVIEYINSDYLALRSLRGNYTHVNFNKGGQPATAADYQAVAEILGITHP